MLHQHQNGAEDARVKVGGRTRAETAHAWTVAVVVLTAHCVYLGPVTVCSVV